MKANSELMDTHTTIANVMPIAGRSETLFVWKSSLDWHTAAIHVLIGYTWSTSLGKGNGGQ